MKILKIIIGALSWIISCAIPRGRFFLFFSYPNYTDNSYALYLYLLSNKMYSKYKRVWIVDEGEGDFNRIKELIERKDSAVIVVPRKSWRAIWYYYRSSCFFFTHSLFSALLLHSNKKRINLWHGMPLKNIGALQHNSPATKTKSDIIISTSELFQKIMARAFLHPSNKVVITGQPRNDLLWLDTDFFQNIHLFPSNYKKVGIWLPTYRKSLADDGNIVYEGNNAGLLSFLSYNEMVRLDELLAKLNYLIIVKLHPMDLMNEIELPQFSCIKIFTKYSFDSQLYPLLGKMDFLLTDYSSVWVDYEILNRPIGFVMDDVDEYKLSRGFTVPNLIELLPGTIINTFEKLEEFLTELPVCGKDNTIWNFYKDNNSSARVMGALDQI